MIFLFNSNLVNILVTVGIIVFLLAVFVLEKRYIKRKGDDITKWQLIILYLILLLNIVAGVILGFYTWNFDLATFLNEFWFDALDFILIKLGDIVVTIFIIFFVSFILKIVKIVLKKSSLKEGPNQKRRITMLRVTRSLINYTLKAIALLVILAVWGVDVLPAVAGLGILGLVVGLGAQSLIKDLIAGFFIIFEHHFDVGDVVEINGFKGKVVDIGLKSTRVLNWKNELKTFANGSISESINFSRHPSVAVVEFGIAYGENIQRTIDILNEELPKLQTKYPDILEPPVVLGVTELANSSVNIRVMIKTVTGSHYGIERGIRQGIKEILDANGIEIPFPQVVVHKGKE